MLEADKTAPADGISEPVVAPKQFAADGECRRSEDTKLACGVRFGGQHGFRVLGIRQCEYAPWLLSNVVQAFGYIWLAACFLPSLEPSPISRTDEIWAPGAEEDALSAPPKIRVFCLTLRWSGARNPRAPHARQRAGSTVSNMCERWCRELPMRLRFWLAYFCWVEQPGMTHFSNQEHHGRHIYDHPQRHPRRSAAAR